MVDFKEFMSRREAAARAFCRGDPALLEALSAQKDPVSFFGPDGGVLAGAAKVIDTNVKGSKAFGPNGETSFEIMQMAADGDIGYWCGVQKATIEIDGRLIPMDLRVTELFRREDGDWKLVHRQADRLKTD